jgi:hypothetical protein
MKILSDQLFYNLLHAPFSTLQKQFGDQLRRLEHYRIDGNDETYTYFSRYSPSFMKIDRWTLSLKEGTYEIHVASENKNKRFLRFLAKKPLDIPSVLAKEHYQATKHYLKGLSACVYPSEQSYLIVSRSSMLAMGY